MPLDNASDAFPFCSVPSRKANQDIFLEMVLEKAHIIDIEHRGCCQVEPEVVASSALKVSLRAYSALLDTPTPNCSIWA